MCRYISIYIVILLAMEINKYVSGKSVNFDRFARRLKIGHLMTDGSYYWDQKTDQGSRAPLYMSANNLQGDAPSERSSTDRASDLRVQKLFTLYSITKKEKDLRATSFATANCLKSQGDTFSFSFVNCIKSFCTLRLSRSSKPSPGPAS